MGTPNFARPNNASKYFVVLTNREETFKECPDCGHKHRDWEYTLEELNECDMCSESLVDAEIETETVYPDEWEVDDLIENIGYEIKEQGGTKDNEVIEYGQYGIQSLGYFDESKSYGDVWLNVRVTAVIQSAYYEGATLDYLIHIDTNNDSFKYSTGSSYDEDLEDILEMAFDEYYSEMNAGLRAIMKPKAELWIEQTIDELSTKVETLFEQWTEHKLVCQGVFSNGEAVYSKID